MLRGEYCTKWVAVTCTERLQNTASHRTNRKHTRCRSKMTEKTGEKYTMVTSDGEQKRSIPRLGFCIKMENSFNSFASHRVLPMVVIYRPKLFSTIGALHTSTDRRHSQMLYIYSVLLSSSKIVKVHRTVLWLILVLVLQLSPNRSHQSPSG